MFGKCPKCEKPVMSLNGEGVEVVVGMAANRFRALTYSCPACHTVLGCQIDPIALKTDTVRELFESLRKGAV